MSTRLEFALRRLIPLLLLAYPSDFRHRFGRDLTATYIDRFDAVHAAGGLWRVAWFLVIATAHSLRDGFLERLAAARRSRLVTVAGGWGKWVTDVRLAMRALLRRPVFLTIAVSTLGLGIGASTTMFSVVDSVLLRPLPYDRAEELVAIGIRTPDFAGLTPVAWRIARTFENRAERLTDVATVRAYQADVEPDSRYPDATRLWAASVSSSFFRILATQPLLGRSFTAAEDETPNARVLILSHAAWIRRWGADSAIIGRMVEVNGERHEVVGVMPPDFTPPEGLRLSEADVLFPALVAVADRRYDNYRRGYFRLVARLAPGYTIEQAAVELSAIHEALQREHAEVQAGRASAMSLHEMTVAGAGQTLWPLFGAVLLLLCIACVNVVNLFLARATSKRREIAVRTALGAGRSDAVRPMAIESMLVAFLGAGVGLVLAEVGVRTLASWSPGNLPRLAEVGVDLKVLAFSAMLALATGALIALAPTIRSLAIHQDALREAAGKTTATRSTHRVRSLLVVAQTAIALVLLIGAGLMIHSFARLMAVDPGFEPEGVLVAHIHLPRSYSETQEHGQVLRQTLLERVRAMPTVLSASTTVGLPLDGFGGKGHMQLTVESAPDHEIEVGSLNWVGPDYFATMGMPLAPGGRAFTGDDIRRDDVVLVNRSFVRAFWPDDDIVGERIKMGPRDAPSDYRTIVGVVGDVRGATLASDQGPAIYYPDDAGLSGPPLILVVKVESTPEALAPAVRAAVRAVAPSAPIGRIETMEHHVARSVTAPRFYTLLIGGFAGAALVLAVVGIYGTLSYLVGQRTREIGVRIALGAAPGMVLKMIVGQGVALGVAGIALGMATAATVSGVLASFLFEVGPLDSATYLVTAGSLELAVLLSTLAPARRATRVDPIEALRSE